MSFPIKLASRSANKLSDVEGAGGGGTAAKDCHLHPANSLEIRSIVARCACILFACSVTSPHNAEASVPGKSKGTAGEKGVACGFRARQDGPLGGVSFRESKFPDMVGAGAKALGPHVGEEDRAALLSSGSNRSADAPLTGGGRQDEESDWEPTPGESGVSGPG